MGDSLGFRSMEDFDVRGKRVLIRVDINSPIDPVTKKIVNTNRIDKTVPTLRWLLERGARLAIIAHQGDTLDYGNLISLEEHASLLGGKAGREISYIDDVCGPSAVERVKALKPGEAVLLGNLRYLCEEISTFENAVKLEPAEMKSTWLIRTLAPLFDLYINDAFAAAHRNAPSMTGFQEVLPSAAGPLFYSEVSALSRVMESPARPAVFVLGGAKISDAFGMMEKVLKDGAADRILTCGVTGEIFLLARGFGLGRSKEKFIRDRSLDLFVDDAKRYLAEYGDRILFPDDLAFAREGKRVEIRTDSLPVDEMFLDVGEKTIGRYGGEIARAGTVFVNGPAGMFEDPLFETGTREIWKAVENTAGYSVIGGGDSVSAAARFTRLEKLDYVCTAGGAMVRFLSGARLPLIEAMRKGAERC